MQFSRRSIPWFLIATGMALFGQTLSATACSDDIAAGAGLGITSVPANESGQFRSTFCKYTEIVAPNGQPIKIFSQNHVTNDQMIRARRILEFFLEIVPDSVYGADKSAVANQMAMNDARLLLLNGRDGENDVDLPGQPLYAGEMTVEGSPGYINNDFENARDASFEEILHLMHDTGIGVDGPNTLPGVLSEFQAEIRAATNNAAENNFRVWPIGADDTTSDIRAWHNELANENSLSQEYLASVVDVYYGLWGADTSSPGGMGGIYIAKTRDEISTLDPAGATLMTRYFNPYLTYVARIDSGFEGAFLMAFDTTQPYTYKSQYLLNVSLTGNNDSDLIGNAQDNRLQGNAGSNTLNGGTSGSNTAIFSGNRSEYDVMTNGDNTIVIDSVANRDGTDTLINITQISFADQIVMLSGASTGGESNTTDLAYYDTASQILHLPNTDIGRSTRYYVGLRLTRVSPLTFEVDFGLLRTITEQGDADATYDAAAGILNIPAVQVGRDWFSVELRQTIGFQFSVTSTTVTSNPTSNTTSVTGNSPGSRSQEAELAFIQTRANSLLQNDLGYWEADFGSGMAMIYVPAGSFIQGNDALSPAVARETYPAAPAHQVNLSHYWIAKTPVTIGQFKAFVQATSYVTDAERPGHPGPFVYDFNSRGFIPKPGYYWGNAFMDVTARFPDIATNERHPVNNVSWNDCIAYTNWLAQQHDSSFTLPTESEWEYAARGTDGRAYPWGNQEPDGTRANYADESFNRIFPDTEQSLVHPGVDDGFAITSPVGSFPNGRSPIGALDMAGNLTEWIYDSEYEYTTEEVTDPIHTASNSIKMQKAGFWAGSAGRFGQTPDEIVFGHNIRSDARQGDDPNSADDHLGCRVAISYTARN
ncbi:MAG: SUMF1/EgtB/PvdO family nonheme iron enzyme [Pseudomonadota bacterium]